MKSQRRCVEPVETDEMILALALARIQILKASPRRRGDRWHDMRQTNDTPSGLIKHQPHIYNHCTPSEFLFGHSNSDRVMGYGLKHEDAFQNTHLGRIER